MPDFDEFTLAKLAREMAMNIRPIKTVFDDYQITEEDFYEISKIEFFKRAVDQFTLEWNSATSTSERLRIQSQTAIEQLLPTLTNRAKDPKEPLAGINDTVKVLTKLAGMEAPKTDAGTRAERFQITINLGADVNGKPVVEKFDKSITLDNYDNVPVRTGTNVPVEAAVLTGEKSPVDRALESFMAMEAGL